MANIYDVQLLNSVLNPQTPVLGINSLASRIQPVQDYISEISPLSLMPTSGYPEFVETNIGATGTVPELATGIMQQAQPFEFLSSANEADIEDEYEEQPKSFATGIADLLGTMSKFTPLGLVRSLFKNSPSYQKYSPGTTISNGILDIGGVYTPASAFGGAFFDAETGKDRFDRARDRFKKSGSIKDLFAASKSIKEFLDEKAKIDAGDPGDSSNLGSKDTFSGGQVKDTGGVPGGKYGSPK